MKTTAIVHVTIAVPVDDIGDTWSTTEVHREAKRKALARAREQIKGLGTVTVLRCTAVTTEGEPEDVKEIT
jgi:hypothetical protein